MKIIGLNEKEKVNMLTKSANPKYSFDEEKNVLYTFADK
jgi:hypothetical protein